MLETKLVKTLPGTIHGGGDLFPPTHWSVVLTAAQTDENPAAAAEALAMLCQTYWAPLYTFVRSRSYGPHDAQDLTQGFFAHLIEHKLTDRVAPSRGKFRSYLLAAMKNYLADAWERERAGKRGGRYQFLPLDESLMAAAESRWQPQDDVPGTSLHTDRAFERTWAQALVDAALERLAKLYQGDDKAGLFGVLQPFITGQAGLLPAYEQRAAELGMPAATLRSHVTRLRARYRDALRAEVRRTVDSEADVDGELRELLRVLTSN